MQIKVRLEHSALCERVQEDFEFTEDQFLYTFRSRSGFIVWQCVKESRKILCFQKISSNTYTDLGRVWVFSSVSKSPGGFCVHERSVLIHKQTSCSMNSLVCHQNKSSHLCHLCICHCVEEFRRILCLWKISSNTHANQGRAWVFGSVSKSPGRFFCLRKISSNTHWDPDQAPVFISASKSPEGFCVYERSVLMHKQTSCSMNTLVWIEQVQQS